MTFFCEIVCASAFALSLAAALFVATFLVRRAHIVANVYARIDDDGANGRIAVTSRPLAIRGSFANGARSLAITCFGRAIGPKKRSVATAESDGKTGESNRAGAIAKRFITRARPRDFGRALVSGLRAIRIERVTCRSELALEDPETLGTCAAILGVASGVLSPFGRFENVIDFMAEDERVVADASLTISVRPIALIGQLALLLWRALIENRASRKRAVAREPAMAGA